VAAAAAQDDEQQVAGAGHHVGPADVMVAVAAAEPAHGAPDAADLDVWRRPKVEVADDEDLLPIQPVDPPPVERYAVDPGGGPVAEDAPGGVPRPAEEALLRPQVAVALACDRSFSR